MSLEVLTAIWRDPPCKGGELLCLLAIADNADDYGIAWPSISTIARKAAIGERGAQKCIRKLVEAGLIQVESGGGRNKTNIYRITTNGIGESNKPTNPEQNTPPPGSPFMDLNPEPAFAKPRPSVHPNCHEPSIEPSSRKNARKSRIPEDAVISENMHLIAEAQGISQEEAAAQFDRFKDNALAKGGDLRKLGRGMAELAEKPVLQTNHRRPAWATKSKSRTGSRPC